MNKMWKLSIGIVAFVVLIAGSMLLYKTLTENYSPAIDLPAAPSSSSAVSSNGGAASSKPASQKEQASESRPEPIPAPDFEVFDAQGNAVKLSDFRGKPVVINFWATWCGYCKEEMPSFQKVWEELGDDVQFLMIDCVDNSRETQEKGEKFILDEGFTFPVYFDTTQEASYTYSVYSLPTTYFIDTEGNIVAGVSGMINEDRLRTGISMAMNPETK